MSSVNKGSAKQRLAERIRAGKVLSRLQRVAMGEEEVTATELNAMRILLAKVLPDLKAVEQTIKDERKRTKQEINDALIAQGIDPEMVWGTVVKH